MMAKHIGYDAIGRILHRAAKRAGKDTAHHKGGEVLCQCLRNDEDGEEHIARLNCALEQ